MEDNTVSGVQSAVIESTKQRAPEHYRHLTPAEIAAQAHLNDLKEALIQVERMVKEPSSKSRTKEAQNGMLTTFKVMQVVMDTLRKSSEASKEQNKIVKKEWGDLSKKQSANNQSSYDNVTGNQKYLLAAQVVGFSPMLLQVANSFHLTTSVGSKLTSLGMHGIPYVETWGNFLTALDKTDTKTGLKNIDALVPKMKDYTQSLSQGGNTYISSMTQAEQYQLGIRESRYQHEVQTHSSEYQNGTQQHNSDSQAVDNASDTAKQLIRVQGEILMGRAG